MILPRLAPARSIVALLIFLAPTAVRSQEPTSTDPIEAINDEFNQKYRELERDRLQKLAELAQKSDPKASARIYETYFRDALGSSLYQDAEPLADQILEGTPPSAVVRYLAEVVNIMAQADRGEFEDSLNSLLRAVEAGSNGEDPEAEIARQSLPVTARLSLLDTYYQRLVQAGEYEIARKAFETVKTNALDGNEPSIIDYLTNRIQQLAMIGREAPAFEGRDVDGNLVKLEDFAGQPVLLVFWATWYRPNAEQLAWMKQSNAKFRDRGLQVIGINLDALASGSRPVAEVLPSIRRYVLEFNIGWPNIINAPGEGDIALAYAVSEIPANVLINREGRIAALDLNETTFDKAVEKVLTENP